MINEEEENEIIEKLKTTTRIHEKTIERYNNLANGFSVKE